MCTPFLSCWPVTPSPSRTWTAHLFPVRTAFTSSDVCMRPRSLACFLLRPARPLSSVSITFAPAEVAQAPGEDAWALFRSAGPLLHCRIVLSCKSSHQPPPCPSSRPSPSFPPHFRPQLRPPLAKTSSSGPQPCLPPSSCRCPSSSSSAPSEGA